MAEMSRFMKSALRRALRAGVAVCALALAVPFATAPALAQSALENVKLPTGERMLLTSDELTFNEREELVIATGGVQIDYANYNLVAERVEYNQATGRMRAIGQVQIIEPDGNRIFADEIDITDDFADGFVNALKIETPDKTRIAATSAERRGGVETTFNHGIYTACEACKKNPEKPPFWQVKAERVIQDKRSRTIKLHNARFELFGMPIAYLPYLEVPDFDNKRKSGLLTPSFGTHDKLGSWLRVPYFLTLGPSADVTVVGTGYTQQGFLLDAEFRRRFENGLVTLRMVGISQMGGTAFNAGTIDANFKNRGLIGSTGRFQINPRWSFGWDVMVETDRAFAKTYEIDGFSAAKQKSQVFLTGLGKRNFFDMRAFKVEVHETTITQTENKEARVHPVVDYNKVFSQPVAGGELSLNINGQSISRRSENEVDGIYRGLQGSNERLTGEVEWRRTFTTPDGLRLTPLLAARGDLHHFETTSTPGSLVGSNSAARGMVTAGLEASYPVLMTSGSSSHVFEPIAQIFVRPNETLAGGLPNEDAQSFVFDATSLFERDKFSGFDRIEGGTRANVGFRYNGTFANGVATQAIFGQSYHLNGLNSFAVPMSLAYAGMNSGLDTNVSDFVGMASVDLPVGVKLAASGRFDKDTLKLQRSDLTAGVNFQNVTASVTYSDIKAQRATATAGYGADTDRSAIAGNLSFGFAENWRAFGSTGYNLTTKHFQSTTVGLSYEDECTALTISYTRKAATNTDPKKWTIGARLSLRTLGDIDYGEATGKSF